MINIAHESDWTTVFKQLKDSDLPEAEKVARAFEWLTNGYFEHGEQEIEMLRALGDQESLIKEQVKLATMKHTISIFRDCYQFMTGRRAWDD